MSQQLQMKNSIESLPSTRVSSSKNDSLFILDFKFFSAFLKEKDGIFLCKDLAFLEQQFKTVILNIQKINFIDKTCLWNKLYQAISSELCLPERYEIVGSWLSWFISCYIIPEYGFPDSTFLEKTIKNAKLNEQCTCINFFISILVSISEVDGFNFETIMSETIVQFLLDTIKSYLENDNNGQSAVFAMQTLLEINLQPHQNFNKELQKLLHKIYQRCGLGNKNSQDALVKKNISIQISKIATILYSQQSQEILERYDRKSLTFQCDWKNRSWEHEFERGSIWLLGTHPRWTTYQVPTPIGDLVKNCSIGNSIGYLYFELDLLTYGSVDIGLFSFKIKPNSSKIDWKNSKSKVNNQISSPNEGIFFNPCYRSFCQLSSKTNFYKLISYRYKRSERVGFLFDVQRSAIMFLYENQELKDKSGKIWFESQQLRNRDYYITICLESFQQVIVHFAPDKWIYRPAIVGDKFITNISY
ncbi:hypothetical protein RDWZM_001263 [Blomia tropicalis]|uniref:Uncharacterized protein n=1 Tax=Blomia tropicalis TaxID=40697 RepID=A0A9Q0MCS6_BLOTA|nr:hypothetical protein BLOT_007222 [Blomia tropicalis]KAJ6222718.1 hypothetical protein RDWZM_001263 [Blomia tropicalis]